MGSCCLNAGDNDKEQLLTNEEIKPLNFVHSNQKVQNSSDFRPCLILYQNPELRFRKNFNAFCCQALKDELPHLHSDDDAMQCWIQIVDRVQSNMMKTDANAQTIESKEDEPTGPSSIKESESDSDIKDDDRWSTSHFWSDITQIDDKITNFFDIKLKNGAINFLIAILGEITAVLQEIGRVPIVFEQLYQLLRAVPVLKQILPIETLSADVIPNPKYSFNNWGLTQHSNPSKIKFLRTKKEIIEFIREANENKKRVRVSVYAHSWAPMFADDGDFQAKLLPDKFTNLYPAAIPLKFNEDYTEVYVEGYPLMYCKLNMKDNRIIVGASTPTMMYVKLVEKRLEQNLTTFPAEFANTVQLHQSFVGTHAVSCHGSGLSTTSITDYIVRLNVINWKGDEVIYDSRAILDKIACHFGLLGIVTEMELQFRDTYYALYYPRFVKYEDFLPETGDCEALQEDVEQNFYNEYFWWPQTDRLYVNSFKITDDPSGAEIHPTQFKRALQQLMAQGIQTVFTLIPRSGVSNWNEKLFAKMIAVFAHAALDAPEKPLKMPGPNGLHYRYGIQNFRMFDCEWLFPLPAIESKITGKRVPDMRVARDLFWESRKLAEEWAERGMYPQLQPCEMRIIKGGGNVALTWTKGCEFICAIEILTSLADYKVNKIWLEYSQEMVHRWIIIIERHMGDEAILLCKPHWGKEWENIEIRGQSIYQHIKRVYKEDIQIFDEIRREADPNNMFMNESWRKIFM